MFRYLLIVLLCLPGFIALGQQPTGFVVLKGRVIDAADTMGAPFVNIIGSQSQAGGVSNFDGTFTIAVLPGDTLNFSSIGYLNKQVILPKDLSTIGEPVIMLYREVYNIDPVTITAPDLRKDFLGDVPQTQPPVSPTFPNTPTFGVSPGGGITFGFDTKAKHIREQKEQISQWEYEEAMRSYIAFRYNPTFIQQFVPVADEQMEEFMAFCQLPDKFIAESSDYDLAKAIKDCYTTFVGK